MRGEHEGRGEGEEQRNRWAEHRGEEDHLEGELITEGQVQVGVELVPLVHLCAAGRSGGDRAGRSGGEIGRGDRAEIGRRSGGGRRRSGGDRGGGRGEPPVCVAACSARTRRANSFSGRTNSIMPRMTARSPKRPFISTRAPVEYLRPPRISQTRRDSENLGQSRARGAPISSELGPRRSRDITDQPGGAVSASARRRVRRRRSRAAPARRAACACRRKQDARGPRTARTAGKRCWSRRPT